MVFAAKTFSPKVCALVQDCGGMSLVTRAVAVAGIADRESRSLIQP